MTIGDVFGKAKWLEPATEQVLVAQAKKGTKRLAVAAPGFSADCVETREELAIRGRDVFIGAGGQDFAVFDCLNADLSHLPPCFIGAVDLDPLRDDSLALAEILAERGVRHRLQRYEGVLHGFLHYSRMLPAAVQALGDGADFFRENLQTR